MPSPKTLRRAAAQGAITTLLVLASLFSAVCGEDPPVDFARDVAPLLETHCLRCHNQKSAKGELSLSTVEGLRKSDFVVAGDPEASHLIEVVSAVDGKRPPMPKESAPLTAEQVDVLRRWVATGANWPADVSLPHSWSLKPLAVTSPPDVDANRVWSRTAIDRFVLRRLQRAGLAPSAAAPRRQLIRRLKLGLLGLQPTPEEIDRFVDDRRTDAWERLVDRYLGSPRYGERWAQHWLDVARFSESDGFEEDAPRPLAWPYRDYVISSLNADKPYDRFVREQLAGDVTAPVTHESIIATGFLVAGPFDHAAAVAASTVERTRAREIQLDEMLAAVTQTFLGLTVNCARCHDHKFDPIPQVDYYRIKAVFEGVDQSEGNPRVASPILTSRERETHQRQRESLTADARRLAASLRDLESRRSALDGDHIPPLNRAVAYWQFGRARDAQNQRRAADRLGGESPVNGAGEARFGQKAAAPIRAVNSDNRVLDAGRSILTANRDDGAGYAMLPTITGELLPRANCSVSIFARVRFTGHFNGTDDVFRAGDRSQKDKDTYGFEFVASGAKQSTARARFVVTARGAEKETGVSSQTPLALDRWYDLAGVFESGADKKKPRGRLTLHLHDPNSGRRIGDPVSKEVPFGSLESGGGQNLLFFVAPYFHNGPQPGAQMDLAAIWHEALPADAIAALSSITAATDPLDKVKQKRIAAERASIDQQVARIQAESKRTQQRLKQLEASLEKSYIGVRRQPKPTVVFTRGDVRQPAAQVEPGGLQAIRDPAADWGLPKNAEEGKRRARFADWVTHPRNPLTARVIVNRVWHHHFGVGIVDTPSDFGVNGGRPSHPRLLDWLAARFIADNWSLKRLHRRIVMSAAWRQASTYNKRAAAVDADNRLIWRFAPRRLDAETIRDTMLDISGELNPRMGGPSFQPFTTKRFNTVFYNLFDSGEPQYNRRTIYRMKVNTGRDPLLDALDCPAPSVLTPRRRQTVTPLQALAIMNDTFGLRQANRLASRIRRENSGAGLEKQIDQAWRRILGRAPQPAEVGRAARLLKQTDLSTLCWMLFNASEFLQLR